MLVVTHVALVTAPVTLYFYVAHADWSWLYLARPSHVPALAILPLVVGHGLLVLAGWYGGGLLIRHDRLKWLVWGAVGTALAFAIAVAIFSPRLLSAGT